MIFVFGVLVLAYGLACAAGAGHQRERSLEARRLFYACFCAGALLNFVVGLVAFGAHDAPAEMVGLAAGAVLVSGVSRLARSMRASH